MSVILVTFRLDYIMFSCSWWDRKWWGWQQESHWRRIVFYKEFCMWTVEETWGRYSHTHTQNECLKVEPLCVTYEVHIALFILLWNLVLQFNSVDETLVRNNLSNRYRAHCFHVPFCCSVFCLMELPDSCKANHERCVEQWGIFWC